MKVRFTPRARGDIEQIYRYADQQSNVGARNLPRAIYVAVRFIAEYPKASLKTNNPGVRVRIVRRYRYKLYYSIDGETIEILHVRHTSRRPWGGAGT
jgi:plasmid stabilization system protein ParE